MRLELILVIVFLVLSISAIILTGCSFDKWKEVNEGAYIPINSEERSVQIAAPRTTGRRAEEARLDVVDRQTSLPPRQSKAHLESMSARRTRARRSQMPRRPGRPPQETHRG